MPLLDSIKQLANAIVEEFSARGIESILLHGSVLFNPQVTPQDVDLVIVLREKRSDDCARLGRIFHGLVGAIQIFVQPHLIYLEELPRNADIFSIHTSGSFFVQHLRQALVLHGSNVFHSIADPSREQFLISLLQKVQQYTSTLRSNLSYLTAVTSADLRQARKRTFVVLKDVLMAGDVLLQRHDEILAEFLRQFPDTVEEDREFLGKLAKADYQLPGIKDSFEFFDHCLTIHEKAYGLLRKQIAEELSIEFFRP